MFVLFADAALGILEFPWAVHRSLPLLIPMLFASHSYGTTPLEKVCPFCYHQFWRGCGTRDSPCLEVSLFPAPVATQLTCSVFARLRCDGDEVFDLFGAT